MLDWILVSHQRIGSVWQLPQPGSVRLGRCGPATWQGPTKGPWMRLRQFTAAGRGDRHPTGRRTSRSLARARSCRWRSSVTGCLNLVAEVTGANRLRVAIATDHGNEPFNPLQGTPLRSRRGRRAPPGPIVSTRKRPGCSAPSDSAPALQLPRSGSFSAAFVRQVDRH